MGEQVKLCSKRGRTDKVSEKDGHKKERPGNRTALFFQLSGRTYLILMVQARFFAGVL